MYTSSEREILLQAISEAMRSSSLFEGLLQLGSGAQGYRDIYSDIDLMAGCYDAQALDAAKAMLTKLFQDLGAGWLQNRAWSETALGISVYFANGLSVDLSFLPTEELPIRSPRWKLLWDKSGRVERAVRTAEAACREQWLLREDIYHQAIFALRKCEIAIAREDWVGADMALHEARQVLLMLEAKREGKTAHQFKAWNTLDPQFLEQLKKTYPEKITVQSVEKAKNAFLELFVNTVDDVAFDGRQLVLLGCFPTDDKELL